MKQKYFIVICVVFFLLSIGIVSAQSSYTKNGLNGAMFDAHSTFNIDNILGNVGGQLGYSIGGILDVGMKFSVAYDEVEGKDSRETNIGLRYGIMLAKQEEHSPVSAELTGNYGYSFIESNYYEDANQQKEGQGYYIRLNVFRNFTTGDSAGIRLGPYAAFRSYSYTIQDISPETEEGREFSPERETNFFYGLIGTYHNKTKQGKTYYVSIEPAMDTDFKFSARLCTGLVFEIR